MLEAVPQVDPVMVLAACAAGDIAALQTIFDSAGPEGAAALCAARADGSTADAGWGPLHVAAAAGRDAVIPILLAVGADALLRKPSIVSLHYLISTVVAVGISLVFHTAERDIPSVLAKAGLMSFFLLWIALTNLSVLEMFLSERPTFLFERHAEAYGTVAYVVSKVVLDFCLLRVIPVAVSVCIFYFPVGLRATVPAFGTFLGTSLLFSLTTTVISVCVAASSRTYGNGVLVNGFIIVFFFAFGGFVAQQETIPRWLAWLRHCSPMFLAWEPLVVNDLHDLLCAFRPRDARGQPTSTAITLGCDQYIYNLGLRPEHLNQDLAVLGVWCVVYGAVAVAALVLIRFGQR